MFLKENLTLQDEMKNQQKQVLLQQFHKHKLELKDLHNQHMKEVQRQIQLQILKQKQVTLECFFEIMKAQQSKSRILSILIPDN